MADTDTSEKSRADSEAAIRAMRAGKRPKQSKKKGKKLLLVAVLVLFLVGGGAAYKLMSAKDETEVVSVPMPEPEVTEPVEVIYMDLDPLFIPFKSAAGSRHKIVVILSLEVERSRQQDKRVRSLLPRLREAYVRALTSRPFPGTEDGSIETVYLKNRIRAENIRILGIGIVNDVLVRDIRVLPG